MKILRHDVYEKYDITVDWLEDFASTITSNPSYLNNIKHLVVPSGTRYSTIEEKLADIRDRVGLDLIKEEREKSENQVVSASEEPEENNNSRHSEENVRKMGVILQFIRDMIDNEEHLNPPLVISKCRQKEGLDFNDLCIDMGKLTNYIQDRLDQKHQNAPVEEVIYEVADPGGSGDIQEDSIADWWNHSQPARD